jgi:hypothetical protein
MTYTYKGREITTSSNKNLKYAVLRMSEDTIRCVIGCRSTMKDAKALMNTELRQLQRIIQDSKKMQRMKEQIRIVELTAHE